MTYASAERIEYALNSTSDNVDYDVCAKSIVRDVLSKTEISYTDIFVPVRKAPGNGDYLMAVTFHDSNKYPHDYYGECFRDTDGTRYSTHLTVDQCIFFHFHCNKADVYLFPLNPPRDDKYEDSVMYDKWSTWERQCELVGNRLVYTISAAFWDNPDYNDHTNFTRTAGFQYDCEKRELLYSI